MKKIANVLVLAAMLMCVGSLLAQSAFANDTYEPTMGSLSFIKSEYERTDSYIEPSFRYMAPGSTMLAQWGANRQEGFNVIMTVLQFRARTEFCDVGKILKCKLYVGAYLPTHWDNPERIRYDAIADFNFFRYFGVEIGRQGNWNIGTGNQPGMAFWNIGTYYVLSDESKGVLPASRLYYRHYLNTQQAATLTREYGVSVDAGDVLKHEFGWQAQWTVYKDQLDFFTKASTFAGSGGLQKVGNSSSLRWYAGRVMPKLKQLKHENLGVELYAEYFKDVSGLSSVGTVNTSMGAGIGIFWGF